MLGSCWGHGPPIRVSGGWGRVKRAPRPWLPGGSLRSTPATHRLPWRLRFYASLPKIARTGAFLAIVSFGNPGTFGCFTNLSVGEHSCTFDKLCLFGAWLRLPGRQPLEIRRRLTIQVGDTALGYRGVVWPWKAMRPASKNERHGFANTGIEGIWIRGTEAEDSRKVGRQTRPLAGRRVGG